MRWDTIVKARPAVVRANMADYEARGRSSPGRMRGPSWMACCGTSRTRLCSACAGHRADAVAPRCRAACPRGPAGRSVGTTSAVADEPVRRISGVFHQQYYRLAAGARSPRTRRSWHAGAAGPDPCWHWSAPWLTRRASSKPRARTAPAALFGSGCGTGTRSTTGQACCRSSRRRRDAACTAACPSATTAARWGALFPNGTILSGAATGRPRASGCTSPTTFPSSPAGSARPCASLPACWRLTSAR